LVALKTLSVLSPSPAKRVVTCPVPDPVVTVKTPSGPETEFVACCPANPVARPRNVGLGPDEKISTLALDRSAIKMFPVTGSAKLMSNEENAPPGCLFAMSAGTGINVGTGFTTSATAGPAVAAIATRPASPKVGTRSDLKVMCLSYRKLFDGASACKSDPTE
jgi:hypothetical protein